MLDKMITAAKIGFGVGVDAEVADPIGMRRTFLNRVWAKDDLSLSERINRLDLKNEIVSTLKQQMRAAKSWQQTANALRDIGGREGLARTGAQVGDVAGVFKRLQIEARSVAFGDKAATKAFQRDLAKAQAHIDKLSLRGAPNQSLKAAYQGIADKARDLDIKGLEKALDVGVFEKARYNAERISRTEIAQAYSDSFDAEMLADDDVIGFRWQLSSRHEVTDICDFHAEADLYGMGPGVYPKAMAPPLPAHPNCMCIKVEVFRGEATPSAQMRPRNAERLLRSKPEGERRKLLGTNGSPSNWESSLKGWRGHNRIDTHGINAEMFSRLADKV